MARNTLLIQKIGEMLTLSGAFQKQGRRIREEDLGILPRAAMLVENGKIAWIGPQSKIPKSFAQKNIKEVSMDGRTVLPGFVECHTHSVFAGNRAQEFEMRLQGASYQEIAAAGGGILSTMKATRAASVRQLAELAQKRVNQFVQQGVTTLEIKSGYGLSIQDELKMLKAMQLLKGPQIISCFLGAHARPPEFSNEADYLQALTEALPKFRKLAERIDIFIEKGFFSVEAARPFLKKAHSLGFQICIHADQLSLSGGSELAVELAALSAEHLIQLQTPQIAKLAKSEVTAVLLPSADLYMKCAYPKAREMIDAGVRVALATDFNPGSSPSLDLSLVGLLARIEMKMSLPEVISAYTVGAAWALGLQDSVGSLELSKDANFISIDKSWRELFYRIGDSKVLSVHRGGQELKIAAK